MFTPHGLVALALAALLVFPACRQNDTTAQDAPSSDGAATPTLVQDYLDVADATATAATDLDAQRLADALRKLAAALGTLGLADIDVQGTLRVAAEHVLSDPESTGTTAAVRNSLVAAAAAIESRGGGGDLQRAAESLRPDQPLADQVAALREFLRRSSALIRQTAGSEEP